MAFPSTVPTSHNPNFPPEISRIHSPPHRVRIGLELLGKVTQNQWSGYFQKDLAMEDTPEDRRAVPSQNSTINTKKSLFSGRFWPSMALSECGGCKSEEYGATTCRKRTEISQEVTSSFNYFFHILSSTQFLFFMDIDVVGRSIFPYTRAPSPTSSRDEHFFHQTFPRPFWNSPKNLPKPSVWQFVQLPRAETKPCRSSNAQFVSKTILSRFFATSHVSEPAGPSIKPSTQRKTASRLIRSLISTTRAP